MGFLAPKEPSVPTPPPAPTTDAATTNAATEAARLERERLRKGFASTVLTSNTGVAGQKTLTGE